MAKDIAVAVIHGMGSQDPKFAEACIDEVNSRIESGGNDPSKIAWAPIYWQDILEPRQSRYFRDAKRLADLDAIRLRRFVLTALGDASAYQAVKAKDNSTYEKIHSRVRETLSELYNVQLEQKSKPLVVFAHSLGGHIMSNYIWDRQNRTEPALSSFERMKSLSGMVTFGCNIPLFTFAYETVKPIKFPAPGLSTEQRKKAKWLNFYDPDDILGYPLKPINAAYKKAVDRDIAVNVGGIFSNWNPISHTQYWTDDDFTRPAARFLTSLL